MTQKEQQAVSPVPVLANKRFFMLNMLLKKFRSQAQNEFLSELNITLEMSSMLKTIEYLGSPSQQEIADSVQGERSSVKRLIDNLISRNLVVPSKSEHNRKVKLISLTADGKHLVDKITDNLTQLEQSYLDKISEKESETLLAITRKLLAD